MDSFIVGIEVVAFIGAVILILMFLLTLALKIVYWTTFAATRGVHDGWNGGEPPPPPKAFPRPVLTESPARAQMRAAMEENRRSNLAG
jgi:hypothetical protein